MGRRGTGGSVTRPSGPTPRTQECTRGADDKPQEGTSAVYWLLLALAALVGALVAGGWPSRWGTPRVQNSGFEALIAKADGLLQAGHVGSAVQHLLSAQESDPTDMRPLEMLRDFRESLGSGISQHVGAAVKAGAERLEKVIYADLYSHGELSGAGQTRLLLRLAQLQMLHLPAGDLKQAELDLKVTQEILQTLRGSIAPSTLELCSQLSHMLSSVLALRKQVTADLQSKGDPTKVARKLLPEPAFRSVDRRAGLSAREYAEEYLAKGRPVIITDYASRVLPGRWGWDKVRSVCGHMPVALKRRTPEARHLWAGLADAGLNRSLASWMDEVIGGHAATDLYLMDWGLVGRCEALLESFIMPQYFAGDLWKRLFFDRPGMRDPFQAHPSIFVGPAGSGGTLHVDSFASTFWQLQLHGTKRWTLFALPDVQRRALLYAGAEHETMASYPLPGEHRNASEFPLLDVAEEFKVVAEVGAGELMVVPSDVAHMVENLDNVLAVSMNLLHPPAVQRAREDLVGRACYAERSSWYDSNLRLLADEQPAAEHWEGDVPFATYRSYGPLPNNPS